MDLVSIIIPVYNSEKYLDNCLTSIIIQTYTNLEIIIIDDGSTDNSGKICQDYAEKDKRIIYIKNINHGVSFSRNYGLSISHGKYISFIDSDDYVAIDFIELMVNCFKDKNIQLVTCKIHDDSFESKKLNKSETFISMISEHGIYGYCWNKMYLNEIIKNNNIIFKEGIYICEDFLFNANYIKYIEQSYCLNKKLYNYVIHDNSALTSKLNKKWFSNLDAYASIINDVKKEYGEDIYGKYLNYVFLKNINAKMKMSLNNYEDKEYLSLINNNIKELKKDALKIKNIINIKSLLYYYFYYPIFYLKKILRKK